MHAHTSGNRFTKSKATKEARRHSRLICIDMQNKSEVQKLTGRVLIIYDFFCPDNRRRDAANMVQSCKAYIDGVVDSLLVEGDHWQVMTIYGINCQIDRKNPRVELRIFSAETIGDMMHRTK